MSSATAVKDFDTKNGRAFPVAEGIKIARPDLNVFVSTGDGDCCSIGAGHWIHALRYNINLTVVLHDNHVYGLTKKQASPTSPRGLKSNTRPYGALLEPMSPLTVSLGVQGASFVAQAVDWIPESSTTSCAPPSAIAAFRCLRAAALPRVHAQGVRPLAARPATDDAADACRRSAAQPEPRQRVPKPARARSDQHRQGREIASLDDPIPVGILYRNPDAPCYEDLRHAGQLRSPEYIRSGLNRELDKFTVWPEDDALATRAA